MWRFLFVLSPKGDFIYSKKKKEGTRGDKDVRLVGLIFTNQYKQIKFVHS